MLYGFGSALVVAAAIEVACLVGTLVVAKRRRDWRRGWRGGPVASASDSNEADRRAGKTRAVAAVAVIAVVAIGGVVILVGRDGGESDTGARAPGTSIECTADEDFETGLCGVDPEALRESNLAYADRVAFSGDRSAASTIAERAGTALAPLAGVRPSPSPDQVADALAPVSPNVVVSGNAVRTAGAAFGIEVDGGCVFGSVYGGAIEVEIGGYINDGGCLAEYGH